MSDQTSCYNLLDEQWIPVLMHTGACTRLSLRETLLQARRVRALAASNPMDRAALLRFLLAVLYWCKGSPDADERARYLRYVQERDADRPPEWADGFPAAWFAEKLGSPSQPGPYHDCFNLLGDGKRFLQDSTAQAIRPVNDLIHEIPTGNNFSHLRHAVDYVSGLCSACCATGLLRLPLFPARGSRMLKFGITGFITPIYRYYQADSLASTLLANWSHVENIGCPFGFESSDRRFRSDEIPMCLGLTFPARRIWLDNPKEEVGRCFNCGTSNVPLIKSCRSSEAQVPSGNWHDPFVVYVGSAKQKSRKASDPFGKRINTWLVPWSELAATQLTNAAEKQDEHSFKVQYCGLAISSNKSADVWEFDICPPMQGELRENLAVELELWNKASGSALVGKLKYVVSKLEQPPTSKPVERKHIKIPATLSSLRPHCEQQLRTKINYLAGAPPEVWRDAAAEAYAPLMQAVAQALAPGASVADTRKRQELARLAPQPQESPPAKPGKSAPRLKTTPRTGGQP